jgi:hypothetical protein
MPSPLPSAPSEYRRHPLGLPAGSVRALLALLVLGVLWLLALRPDQQIPVVYVYLQYVMILILASFFAAHGSSIGRHISQHHPLRLPGGTVRFVLLTGYLALVAWLFYNKAEFEPMPTAPLILPLVLLTAFFLGYLTTRLVKAVSTNGIPPDWFQDVQAWLALLAMLGLAVIVLSVFIRPTIRADLQFDTMYLEMGVSAILGFYFGARS